MRMQRTREFQSEYQRENLETVTAEECKQDGQWTKWVIERCNEEQKQMFYDLRARLEKQGYWYLSDNNVLRYLNSYLWNIDTAEMRLVNTEKWRVENDCMKVNINEVKNEIDMKVRKFFKI